MSNKRSEFIDFEGEPVFINTQLQVSDGQPNPIGFIHFPDPPPSKPRAKRRTSKKSQQKQKQKRKVR
jgi:hypothetical protein